MFFMVIMDQANFEFCNLSVFNILRVNLIHVDEISVPYSESNSNLQECCCLGGQDQPVVD